VMIVRLEVAGEPIRYYAGQYINIVLPDGQQRSFSFATAPHESERIELQIRRIPGGLFTTHVFEQMKVGDTIRFEGPLGSFFLREDSDKPIIFVAGGTGFAPIKGIIEHALHHHIDATRPIVLYWGVRAKRDLYLPDLPGRWQQEAKNFTFIPVLSEPAPEDQWPGRTGLVHQAVLDDFADLSGYQLYVCGGPAMVDAARKSFTETRGLSPDDFFSDSFTYGAETQAPAP
jgi:CDP-4-dehydro-6-deoxyglucose reductase, E3